MLSQDWAVVEAENNFILGWFVRLVKNDVVLEDGSEATTIVNIKK